MRTLQLILLIFLFSCKEKQELPPISITPTIEPLPDTAYIPLAKDFGDELFVPKKYGIWNTNGFCYVYQNDSLQSFYPFCGYPNQDTTKPINCIVMFGLDTVSGVLHSQIYLNKMVLEKGTYYETEPQSSPSSRFLFAAATENGCSDLGAYFTYDSIPQFSHFEITDVDKQRRIVCGTFQMRTKLHTRESKNAHLPEFYTFKKGVFATRY